MLYPVKCQEFKPRFESRPEHHRKYGSQAAVGATFQNHGVKKFLVKVIEK